LQYFFYGRSTKGGKVFFFKFNINHGLKSTAGKKIHRLKLHLHAEVA